MPAGVRSRPMRAWAKSRPYSSIRSGPVSVALVMSHTIGTAGVLNSMVVSCQSLSVVCLHGRVWT
jgi:hypothetical protein